MAIASYERTQFTNQSPFDDFIGGDNDALTPQEIAGRDVFTGAGLCDNCHQNALMSDNSFRYTGVRPHDDDRAARGDRTAAGRGDDARAEPAQPRPAGALHAQRPFRDDRGRDRFLRPRRRLRRPNIDPSIQVLNLTQQQKDDLLAFLGRPLTDPRLVDELPPFDRPTLYAESDRVPVVEGAGAARQRRRGARGGGARAALDRQPELHRRRLERPRRRRRLAGDRRSGSRADACRTAAFHLSHDDAGGRAPQRLRLDQRADPERSRPRRQEWFGRWYVIDPGGGFPHAVYPGLPLHGASAAQPTTTSSSTASKSGESPPGPRPSPERR